MDFPEKAGIPWEKTQSGDYNEDCFLCCKNKVLLEENGMRFAPLDVAVHFGREHTIPENEGIEPFFSISGGEKTVNILISGIFRNESS